MLQVEYTRWPPGTRSEAPRTVISTCILNIFRLSLGVQSHHTSRFFRVVAVPVQGTSAMTASKPGGGSRPKCRPSCCVTTTLANPKRLRLLTSMLSRPDTGSLATTTPLGCKRSPSCVVLEPGAAHMSRARHALSAWRRRTGSMLAASCRVIRPVSCSSAIMRWAKPSGARPRANGMTKAASSPIHGSSTAPKALTCSTVHARSLRWWEIRNVSGSGSSAVFNHASSFRPK